MVARRKKGKLEATVRKARSTAGKMVRDALESAQGTVQSRLGGARDQATETWDNLEALFQTRVHKALQQIGVPSAEEIRLLTQRVAELNDNVLALAAKSAGGRVRGAAARGHAKGGAVRSIRRVAKRKVARATR
jgi:poly(hydroxyalkanoate) granule-associated protein